VDGVTVGTAVTNSYGIASLNYTIPSTMSLGAHIITATFAGTTRYNASSGTGTLQVKANTTLVVSSVRGPRGTTVTLQATLRRASNGVPLSSKTVTFKVDGVVVGTAVTDLNGIARRSYTVPTGMSIGTHSINGVFAGDSLYNVSSGNGTLIAD
jgi:hypothetical protein